MESRGMKVFQQSHFGAAAMQRRDAFAAPDPLAPLLADANAGDRVSMGRILQATAPAVLSVVRVIMGSDNPDVPDVAQESLLAVKDALRNFRGEASVVQYARQVAVRTALSARRGRNARDRLLERFRRESEIEPDVSDTTDPVLRARRTAAFRHLLDDLPDEQAETFALRVVLDYSLDQVAAATGAPVNTVRSRVRLAREKLKQRIEGDPDLMDMLRGEA
jgi:RNA polymerase sigma-70 factor (ECF subfamily)